MAENVKTNVEIFTATSILPASKTYLKFKPTFVCLATKAWRAKLFAKIVAFEVSSTVSPYCEGWCVPCNHVSSCGTKQ